MDIDEDQPIKQPGPEKQAQNQKGASQPKPSPNDSRAKHSKAENSMFNMNNLGKTDPFTNTNSTGINNLQDIHATLPFESRTKSSSTIHNIRPRDLDCPNPPKRPRLPPLLPISTGSTQLTLTRTSWNRYVAEMNTYMREWNEFNGKMLGHFNARHEAVKTGLAPGWIGAVGDSTRLNLNQLDVQDDRSDRDDGDVLVPGSAKGGYSAYLRGLEEDVKVRKHWEVACELHQECIMELGQIREWIRNGGRLSEV